MCRVRQVAEARLVEAALEDAGHQVDRVLRKVWAGSVKGGQINAGSMKVGLEQIEKTSIATIDTITIETKLGEKIY